MKMFISLLVISLFLFSFISATEYSDCSIYGNCKTPTISVTFNNNTGSVNDSYYLRGLSPQEVADLYDETPGGNNNSIQFNQDGEFEGTSTWRRILNSLGLEKLAYGKDSSENYAYVDINISGGGWATKFEVSDKDISLALGAGQLVNGRNLTSIQYSDEFCLYYQSNVSKIADGLPSGEEVICFNGFIDVSNHNITGIDDLCDSSGNCYNLDDLNTTGSGGSSLWTQNGSDIYYNTGDVSIGTTSCMGEGDLCVYDGSDESEIIINAPNVKYSTLRLSTISGSLLGGYIRYLANVGGEGYDMVLGMHGDNDADPSSDTNVMQFERHGTKVDFLKPAVFQDDITIGAGIKQTTNLIFNDEEYNYNFSVKTDCNDMFNIVSSTSTVGDYVSIGSKNCVEGETFCVNRGTRYMDVIQNINSYQGYASTLRLTSINNKLFGGYLKYDYDGFKTSLGIHGENDANASNDVDILTIDRYGDEVAFHKPVYFYGNTSGTPVSVWASSNISATGYITRTKVWNEEENGRAMDNFQNYKKLLNNDGSINHSAYGSCAISYEVVDRSRPVYEECDEDGDCPITYPYNKTEEGVLMDCMLAKFEQALSTYRNAMNILDSNETITPILQAEQGIATPELYFMSKPYKLTGSGLSKIKDKEEHKNLDGSINYESYGEDNKKIKVKKKIKDEKTGEIIEVEEEINLIDAQSRINVLEQAIFEMVNCVEISSNWNKYQECILEERSKIK